MARRKRNRVAIILAMVGIATLWMMELIRRGDWWTVSQTAAVVFTVAGFWVLFLRSTRCGYTTHKGSPCRRAAPGELRGCKKYHKGLKAEALLNHLGIKHPRQQMQRAWIGEERSSFETGPVAGKLERPTYDIVMLVATIVSALAAVAMPVIQMVID